MTNDSGSDPEQTTSDGGPAVEKDGGSQGSDGGTDAGPPKNPNEFRGGYVGVYQADYTPGVQLWSTSASFSQGISDPSVCTTSKVGTCDTSVCGPSPSIDYHYVSAGAVSFEVRGQTVATLLPGADNKYTAVTQQNALLFSGGEMLTARIAGSATIPAATMSITAPSKLLVSFPEPLPAGQKMTLNAAQDMTVSWSGGVAGSAIVTVGVSGTGTLSGSVRCEFAASSGVGVVPSAALMKLPHGTTGSITVSGVSSSTKQVGDWPVTVQAYTYGVTSNNAGYAVLIDVP